MQFFSLANQSLPVDFREATIRGQAPDRGLYFPASIPQFDFATLKEMSKAEIAFNVMKPYVGDAMPDDVLRNICAQTIDFEMPLASINERISSLELFHGPTLAFKDVGARFMSRCLGFFAKDMGKEVTVLVATSGDTGGAVANGFLGVPGVRVVILYPAGRVSDVQELQLTTLGQNISALEIDGSFDDCQAMVKEAFMDHELQEKLFLTSANSINIARWIPQQLYYIYALQQWKYAELPVISVPSGNFGNIAAGLLAYKSGLPLKHFIAACNANDVFPSYLNSGNYQPTHAKVTLSNAMDVGDPSNFVRVLKMLGNLDGIRSIVSSESVNDDETLATIREVYERDGYTMDPHGAVAYRALQNYLVRFPTERGFILETAHPVKFASVVESATHTKLDMPPAVKALFDIPSQKTAMKSNAALLKEFLLASR